MPYWTLKENLLGHKRAQDKSQKKRKVSEKKSMHRGGTGPEGRKMDQLDGGHGGVTTKGDAVIWKKRMKEKNKKEGEEKKRTIEEEDEKGEWRYCPII